MGRITFALLFILAMTRGGNAEWLNVKDFGASGSKFETTATTTAGSNQITVKDVGDFKVGQGIMVSKCDVRYTHKSLWGPRKDFARSRPLGDAVEVRGYDGSAGSWVVYVLDIEPGSRPPAFRWTDDLGRTWKPSTPITYEWQPLGGGTEVKFNKLDWESGYVVVISARDQLITSIVKVEGNTLTLKDAPNRSVQDAVVRHCDDAAIQAAVDQAIKQKKNVYVPIGHYRLARGITVREASAITIEGQSAVDTVLDISEGEGSCISLKGGTEATVRNFRMMGHMGFDQRDQAGAMRVRGATAVWGFYFKTCNALNISGTERVLVENCHATRMSCECFYSQGPGRWKGREPKNYTKAITYLRCSVVDCARNAFNNNDFAENTSVLYCRIVDVGGCSWEGASRFVRFIGNYVRNAGTVAMGNIRSRDATLEELGSGQHIIADNVFESNIPYGGCAIRAQASATEVIIRNNLFINFNSSAIELASATGTRDMPASNGTVTGNIFDMTCVGQKPISRIAVDISASDVIVGDNQIYVRGQPDPLVTGIRLREPALNVQVHNNLVRNCGVGLATGRCPAAVGEVVDSQTFLRAGGAIALPLERRQSHLYKGWNLVWMSGAKPQTLSILEGFDPETLRFRLREPHPMKVGDRFEVFPSSANWNIHNNTFAGCLKPVILNSYGSHTSFFRENLVARDGAVGVKEAVEVRGQFHLIGNTFNGFDEKDSTALALYGDPLGRVSRCLFQQNIFQRCANVVTETQKGLWDASRAYGNLFVDCGGAPPQSAMKPTQDALTPRLIEPPKRPTLRAPKIAAPVVVDGDVSEWPWKDASRVAALAQTPMGDPLPKPLGAACAGWDDAALYLAIRVLAPKGAKPGGADWGRGDGVEVSFQSADPKTSTPIFLLWGSADGQARSGPFGGASEAQVEALQKGVTYAARIAKEEWTCEWRIPFAATGFAPAPGKKLRFNFGAHHTSDDSWSAWIGTGAQLYLVDKAGDLLLEK